MSAIRPLRAPAAGVLVSATAVVAGLVPGGAAQAAVGTPAADGRYAYTARLAIGEEAGSRACTATLVDQWWIATAASCFASDPQQPGGLAAGKPAVKATVTLSGGQRTEVTEIAPRADRDLVLARLAVPAVGATTAKLATTAPVAGRDVTAAGFGRTKTAWVPGKLHTAAFATTAVDATTMAVTGKGADSLCKGDTGAPVLNTAGALTAVAARSWQGGCLGTDPAETRTGAVAARVDDLGEWIGRTTAPRRAAANEAGGNDRIRWADFDGDGKADYIGVADSGAVSVWLNKGGDPAGANGWQPLGVVATGLTNDPNRVRFADFDGDGKADYFHIKPDGAVEVYLNNGGDPGNGWKGLGQVAAGLGNDPSKVRFADWDGDGRSDYLAFDDGGGVTPYLNRGGDLPGGQGWPSPGKVTTGSSSDRNRVRFADSDGDGKADYFLVKPNGNVDLYLNRGGDVVPNDGWKVVGRIATGLTTDHTKVQFVDFNADTHADYLLAGPGGSASVFAWNGGDPGNGWTDLGKVASGT
ncbi:FG-GAP-like repeat-containing protein [Streptomyces sp. NPDC059355]|uniref:FG-GAP-like repeat-containing protein n=1 Tax=Streptomyces sp. NPDC059355 TaxID=3346811 RepID=UPI0036B12B13